jgi:magnesium-transporting ATPase (P-type)
MLKFFITGFIVKALSSFDDVVTRIPLISYLVKTRKGKVAFSIGNLFAVFASILAALAISKGLIIINYTNIIAAGLIFLIAMLIHFDWFTKKEHEEIKRTKKKIKKRVKSHKFTHLVFAGFIISLITLIDDTVVLIPIFFNPLQNTIYAVIGIIVSTIIQILLVIYSAEKIAKIKYLKQITVLGLIILAFLILFKIV